jgi:hypothetical protein
VILQAACALLMIASMAMGYASTYGYLGLARHIPFGFISALIIVFAHSMTLFYFAGVGASMREAVGRHADLMGRLEEAARLRRGLALPLGLAIVTLMAAVILGGGSHTRKLPAWVHHGAALAALLFNLAAAVRSIRSIGAHETLIEGLEDAIEDGPAGP